MKRIFTLIACLAGLTTSAKTINPLVSPDVVISEVYTGGGNASAVYANDFVELYNAGATVVNLAGYTLQYGSAANLPSGTNFVTLSGNIGPGEYFLVRLASGGVNGAPVPPSNISSTAINMSGTAGKIFLVSNNVLVSACNDVDIVDFVGYGATAACSEGANASAPNSTQSLNRTPVNIDTDNNSTNFVIAAPSPQTTSLVVAVSTIPDFTASKSGNAASLKWAINCNAASITMELQRSSNARDFNTIYSEQADQARCAQPFTATDNAANKGVNYYRLRVINADGEISYSNIASVKFGGNEDIKVIPTIATNDVHVFYEASAAGKSTWTVYDMSGRSVNNTSAMLVKGQNNITVNVSSLQKGQYQISGVTPAGRSTTVTFVKQ